MLDNASLVSNLIVTLVHFLKVVKDEEKVRKGQCWGRIREFPSITITERKSIKVLVYIRGFIQKQKQTKTRYSYLSEPYIRKHGPKNTSCNIIT